MQFSTYLGILHLTHITANFMHRLNRVERTFQTLHVSAEVFKVQEITRNAYVLFFRNSALF